MKRYLSPPTISNLELAELRLMAQRCHAAEMAGERAERELVTSRQLQRELLEALPGGVVRIDLSGAIRYANAAAQRILGLSYEDLTARFVSDFQNHTLYEDGSRCPVEDYPATRCLATGEPQPPAMIGVERPDSSIAWGVFSAIPLRDPHTNALKGTVVTFLDVTERKLAEMRLRESEERYRRLVQNAPDGIVVHHQGRIKFVNAAAVRLYGASTAEQLIGRSILEFIEPELHARTRERIRRCQEAGETMPQVEQELTRFDGSRVIIEVTGTPCIFEGDVCTQAILRDISIRKQVEVALQRANVELEHRVQTRTHELSRKNEELEGEVQVRRRAEVELQEKQRFLERMLHLHERERQLIAYEIHDTFVQDLIAALMFCDSFAGHRNPADPSWEALEQTRSLLRRAIDEARRTISGLRPTIIDEQGIVAAIEFLISEYRQRGLQIDFTYDANIPRMPSLLEGNIFRIVQEALTNLQRHSGTKSGQVTLLRHGDILRLEIADKGVGFNTKKVPDGRFGLQGMKERARLVAGRFRVDSAPRAGTRVSLEMPVIPIDESGEG